MDQAVKFTERKYYIVLAFVTSLFLLWGVAITMGDVLNKHFQNVLQVSKSQSGLVQFSIFGAYAVMGIPAGLFMKKYGYKNGVLLGLCLYALGAFLFIPAASAASFGYFRLALFVLACGLSTLEVVAHPFMAALGPQATSDVRLNFAQAFNGLGAITGPLLGGYFLLGNQNDENGNLLDSVKLLYLAIGMVVGLVALAFYFVRVPPLSQTADRHTNADLAKKATKPLFKNRHFVFAVIAQFFNVAAQGGTWAYFINYGHEKMGLTDHEASYYFSLSMVFMMLGRFIGTFLLKYIRANRLLAIFAMGNMLMCLLVAQSWGWVSFAALLMINFFFSIMFPTIFSLGLKDLGSHTQQASSFIVMGVVGGALFPGLMGLIADKDVAQAYYLPIICYLVIFLFGWKGYKINGA